MENSIEVWGHMTYRPFRIYWILEEYNLKYKSYKIGSRTGETQTPEYLNMNPKGKIPLFKHNDIYITESIAAMHYVAYNFKKPSDFFIPTSAKDKAKIDEWSYFCAMELDALSINTLRRHEQIENRGLSNIYGNAPNAIKTAKEHFARMINACERDVPEKNWLMGSSPSCADIMFMSCLQAAKIFKLEIKSKKILAYIERVSKRHQYINAVNITFGENLP